MDLVSFTNISTRKLRFSFAKKKKEKKGNLPAREGQSIATRKPITLSIYMITNSSYHLLYLSSLN